MSELRRTALHPHHLALEAKLVPFGGWEMPLLYPTGIVAEHLAARSGAALFDVSHMGRFILRGPGAIPFLQHLLTNNAEALDVGEAHYTLIPTETGGALDDAYLYRFLDDEYLLVVNAANRQQDWEYFQANRARFDAVDLQDHTEDIAMLALQGPQSRALLLGVMESGSLPEPQRNQLSIVTIAGAEVRLSRTGYTGEPLAFELFLPRDDAPALWDLLLSQGAVPAGLGARDTLRLEAALPLYGHELGSDAEGAEIPIFACPSARPSVSFSPLKGDFVGRAALARQQAAYERMLVRDYSRRADLPRLIQPLALTGQGVARAGAKVLRRDDHVGCVTSGTMVPAWQFDGEGLTARPTEEHQLRSICLAYLDCDLLEGDALAVEARGRAVEAVVVPYHLRSEAPPHARPILHDHELPAAAPPEGDYPQRARALLRDALVNTTWRRQECINLIPSEMTDSPMVRLLSTMDPAFRYAEHRQVKAFYDADVFYYQGVDFIARVEHLLVEEMRAFLGCAEVEARVISGQMANATVFSGFVDYLNRGDRKREPRR
ncbi:MAG: glycine cleavage system aminomethyltransferase GcvT, partial [Armatimonadetes bacterium]|nr:glycine cleavage system aminomethyltransferase GcvT [Armatimonadota bacterium]